MANARIGGSITEWQPYALENGEKFIFRRPNGDTIATIGAHEIVETANDKCVYRFDVQAQCFVPVDGNGPQGLVAKPVRELPRSY